ncbi:MAG: hydroxypyruvate isomerase family protein, partial [bacterium]
MPVFCANLSFLFHEAPFPERFALAARAGFRGVEYLFPYDWPAAQVREWRDANRLVQVLHNLPAGDWAAGESGLACLPGREGEFQDSVALALDYARTLGCRRLNCLAGSPPAGSDPDRVRGTLLANLRFAAHEAQAAGVRLLVEPINSRRDMPGFWLDRSAKAEALIAEVAPAPLGLQYDLYHMQVMEGDLAPTLERLMPLIGHMQFADTPGRHQPGTGELRFDYLFEQVDALGYRGWIGAEYRP